MTKQRLYHSQFNHRGFEITKGAKSRAHNCRAKIALQMLHGKPVFLEEICSPDLIQNNLVFVDGKKIDPLDGDQLFDTITKSLAEEKKAYLEKINNAYSDSNKAELSDGRAKAKAALKRYVDGSQDLEKDFWQGLIKKLGSEEIDPENEILNLKNTTDGKIKRFNQKVKRLKELEKYNSLLGVKSRNTEFTVFSKEILYKIPDDSKLSIKPIDFANFANQMNKKLFPDFRVTYLSIHCDEDPDNAHAHCEFSGLNLKTKEMDIQHQLFLNLEKQLKLQKKPFPFSGRSYNDLSNTEENNEVKQFGEIYQTFIFAEMNKYLQKKGYDAKLEKRTEQEKKEQNKDFLKQKASTQDREFTRANKLKEQADQAKIEAVKNIKKKNSSEKKLVETEKKLISKSEELEQTNEKIKEAYQELSGIEKLTVNAKSALKAALDFAENPRVQRLLDYKENFQKIRDDAIAEQIKTQSIRVQPNEEQANQVRKNSRRGSGNRM